MKKMLCLALALMLVLGSTAALAESATLYGWITVDQEQCAPLMDIPEGELADALFAVINNLGFVMGVDESGAAKLQLTLQDTGIINADIVEGEQDVSILTDLIPNYAINMPLEALTGSQEDEQMAVLMNFGMQFAAILQQHEATGGEALLGELQGSLAPCDVELYGEKYNIQGSAAITKEIMQPYFTAVAELLQQSPEVLAMLDMTVEDIPAFSANMEAMIPEEGFPVTLYGNNETGTVYERVLMPFVDMDLVLEMEMLQSSAETAVYLLVFPYSSYTDNEAAVNAIDAGDEGIYCELTYSVEDEVTYLDGTLLMLGEWYGFLAGTWEEAGSQMATTMLYYNNFDAPFMTIDLQVVLGQTYEFPALTAESKAALNVADMSAEDEQALMMDLQSFGLPNALVAMAQIMPDEMTVLLNAMMAQ